MPKVMLMESHAPATAKGTTQLIVYTNKIQRMIVRCGHNSNGASLYQARGKEEAGSRFIQDKCSPE